MKKNPYSTGYSFAYTMSISCCNLASECLKIAV